MKAIAIYLELDKEYFNSHINEGNSVLRAIHYPPYEIESGERSGPHGDINLITLLIGGNKPGLEICIDDEWHPVETPQSTVVCNVGDMLERFTNHRLPSVIHRVNTPSDVSKNSSRFSIPFFLHPNPDWFIQTLESCVDDGHPNQYSEGIMADDFLQQRLYEIKLL
jgi:isopenicillin N synthase-like dioxygenase